MQTIVHLLLLLKIHFIRALVRIVSSPVSIGRFACKNKIPTLTPDGTEGCKRL